VPEASSATRHGTAIMRNKAASIRLKSIFEQKMQKTPPIAALSAVQTRVCELFHKPFFC
jgi:hypothetical protein